MLAIAGRRAKVRTKYAHKVSYMTMDWLLDLAVYDTRSPLRRVAFAGVVRMCWSMASVASPLGPAR